MSIIGWKKPTALNKIIAFRFSMIDKKDFTRIKKELEVFEEEREKLVKVSRDILRYSKYAIFSVHKNDLKGAKENLDKVEKEIKSTKKICDCRLF